MRLVLGLIVCALLAPLSITNAQERAIHWARYDVAVTLQSNGDLRVVETQRLQIDQGTFRTGSRSFTTGSFGQVRSVSVSEDGEEYQRGSEQPGTFSASDNGEQFRLSYVFRDPSASSHTMEIAYTIARSLSLNGDQAILQWNFFCADASCPRIDDGSLTFQIPEGFDASTFDTSTTGPAVMAASTASQWRWELRGPIQGEQVTLNARFPRSELAAGAAYRSDSRPVPAQPDSAPSPYNQPLPGTINQPSPAGFSLTFCVVALFILIVAFSIMGRGVRRRNMMGGPIDSGYPIPPTEMGGYGFPRRRRYGRRWGRGYGGWGIPPIIIPPMPPTRDNQNPWDGPFEPGQGPNDDTSGGGGFSWDNSGGGGTSWDNSGGGGSSWGDSGGGGVSWGDNGGGGSSWGGDGGGGGGGSNDSSNFN